MADDGGSPVELADGLGVVIGDLLNTLVGKALRVVNRLCDGLRVIGPAWGEGRIAVLFKEGTPRVPTGCEEPEAVYEDHRLLPLLIGAVDLLLFLGRKNCHMVLLWVCQVAQSVRLSRSFLLRRESRASPAVAAHSA